MKVGVPAALGRCEGRRKGGKEDGAGEAGEPGLQSHRDTSLRSRIPSTGLGQRRLGAGPVTPPQKLWARLQEATRGRAVP